MSFVSSTTVSIALVSTSLFAVSSAAEAAAAPSVVNPKAAVGAVAAKKKKKKVKRDVVRAVPVAVNKVRIVWPKPRDGSKKVMIKVAKNPRMDVGVRKFKAKGTSKVIKLPAGRPGWDWYYRVLKPGGGWLSGISALRTLNLKVGDVTNLSTYAPQSRGLELRWTPTPNAQNYRVAVATNPSMAGAAIYNIRTSAGRFSPPNLAYGVQHYFTVQASNRLSTSNVASTSGTSYSRMTRIVAGSFNITRDTAGFDLNSRLDTIASIIRQGDFDFVGIQEAATDPTNKLLGRLGDYRKTTQVGPGGFNSTGGQIFYKPSVLRPLSTNGIVYLTNSRAASYQLFQKVSDGAQFFAVSIHLSNGSSLNLSNIRKTQTQQVLSAIQSVNPAGLPTFFVGDFNSNWGNYKVGYDAPYEVMSNSGIPDSVDNAINLVNHNFNSFNGRDVKPRKGGYHVDHIFTTNGVVPLEWQVMVRVAGGRYITPFASDHNPVRLVADIPF